MKIYTFGAEDAPVLLLLPGTCCHWKSNFGAVIPLLADSFRVLCVSYDGFDETEQTEFPTMLEETKRDRSLPQDPLWWSHPGSLRLLSGRLLRGAAGGTAKHPHRLRHSGKLRFGSSIAAAARLQTNLLLPLIYPVVRDGSLRQNFSKSSWKNMPKSRGDYVKAFLKMFGDARPYVTMQSCKNQFYSDLITPLPDKIHVPGTEIHIFTP